MFIDYLQVAEVIFFRFSELTARPEELARGRQFTTKVCLRLFASYSRDASYARVVSDNLVWAII